MRRRLFRTGSRRTGGRPWVGLRGYPVDLRGPLGGGGPDLGWLVRPPGVGSRFLRTLLWGGRLGAIRWFRTPGRSGRLYRWPESPGGLLGMLFDPAQHAGLRYAGMAQAGNAGLPYTSASSRGLTDQILGQPIPTGGFGIGTGLPGGVAPSGLGTPVNVRAARLAATPDATQAAQVQGALPGGPDWWNTVMGATRK